MSSSQYVGKQKGRRVPLAICGMASRRTQTIGIIGRGLQVTLDVRHIFTRCGNEQYLTSGHSYGLEGATHCLWDGGPRRAEEKSSNAGGK